MARIMPECRSPGLCGLDGEPQLATDLSIPWQIRDHLERRLWQTEARIRLLSHELGIGVHSRARWTGWPEGRTPEALCDSWASLDRLVAARETLIEALRSL
jgi:hypothetical protein